MTNHAERTVHAMSAGGPMPYGIGKTDVIRVLFVEDDDDYREALAGDLADRGFSVRGFADGASFLEALDAAAVDADVVILDWSLPQTSGIDLLPQMRRRGINLPVVFLTGRSLTKYETLAFDRGAIDFIDKARGVDVLVKRLRRAIEAGRPIARLPIEKSIVRGRLELRPNISRAYWNQIDVGLTIGEYNIVHLLATNAGRYVTYRAIYDRMHYEGFIAGSGDHGYRSNVRSAIKRIRIKFRECDPEFAEIENYMAFGYCWGRPTEPE